MVGPPKAPTALVPCVTWYVIGVVSDGVGVNVASDTDGGALSVVGVMCICTMPFPIANA